MSSDDVDHGWGHGPKTPVPVFTEDQVREALRSALPSLGDEAKIELVIVKLKEMT